MHVRPLGNTDIQVSVLGLGSSPFRNGKPEVCAQLIRQAVDLGVTYYDTARSYINGEEAVSHLPATYKDRLVVATKTGARFGKNCLHDLQRSLSTMKRDRIDVWMSHMIRTDQEYELCTELGGFCDIAIAARGAGLIRATGASFHAPTSLILRAIEERAFDVVMFQVNLIGRETVFGSSIASYRDILLPAARANGIGVVVMKVLAGGEMRHGAPRLDFLASNGIRNSIGNAVRYPAMHPHISTAVVGIASTHELMQSVAAVEGIDDSMLPQFEEWTRAVGEMNVGDCTRCGACLNVCPEMISIPKVFRAYDQYRFFGMDLTARYRYSELERNASWCRRCLKCQDVCPEDFDIGEGLDTAHKALQSARLEDVSELAAAGPGF